MSFFRRNNDSQPAIPPVQDYNAGPNKLQRPPPQDRYGSSGSQQQQYGGGGDRYGAAPDRYGAAPDRYGAAPDRYGAAPDRYGGAPDRYGQQQQQPDRYGAAPDRYGGAPDRYAQQQPPPQQQRYGGPPPQQQQQQQQPDRYARSGQAPDRYGAPPDRYGQNPSPAPGGQQRRANPSDPYSRGGADVDADRAALFAGRNPDAPKRLGQDGTQFKTEADWDRQRQEGGNEEEDVEAIKSSIRQTKQESLASTRNALRIAREAEETGMNTLLKLGDQSEKLGDSEQHIDMAKYNSMKAADKVDELKQLNKSIFRPVIVFNKDKKRAAQEQKILARHNEARDERERNAAEVRATQARIGDVAMSSYGGGGGGGYGDDGYGPGGSEGLSAPTRGGGYRTQQQDSVRKEQRKRFQFEATASDDELEDELEDNLDGISNAVANMKKLGIAMGQEVDRQNDRLKKFETKVDDAEQRVVTNTTRMRKF